MLRYCCLCALSPMTSHVNTSPLQRTLRKKPQFDWVTFYDYFCSLVWRVWSLSNANVSILRTNASFAETTPKTTANGQFANIRALFIIVPDFPGNQGQNACLTFAVSHLAVQAGTIFKYDKIGGTFLTSWFSKASVEVVGLFSKNQAADALNIILRQKS